MSVVADIQTALKTNSKKTKIQLMDEGYQPFKGNPPYEKRIFFCLPGCNDNRNARSETTDSGTFNF